MICYHHCDKGCWCTRRWGPRADGVVECGLIQGGLTARHGDWQRCGEEGGSARSPPPYTNNEDVTTIEKDGQISRKHIAEEDVHV